MDGRQASFLERHRGLLLAVMTIVGVVTMIWLDGRRGQVPKGHAMPTGEVHLDDGTALELSSLRGRPVVLDFWASWCGPCRAGLPKLDALSKRYVGRAAFYAVNVENEALAEQQRMRASLGLAIPMIADGRALSGALGVEMLPTTVLFDAGGNVIASFVGASSEHELAHALDEALR